MPKKSRVKGAVGEREIVNVLRKFGIPAKRISMMETGGIDKGDVEVAGVWKASVKYGEHVPKFIYDARENEEDLLFVKRIGKSSRSNPWIIAMDLDFFLDKFL